MKEYKKNILILGGIYVLVATPFLFIENIFFDIIFATITTYFFFLLIKIFFGSKIIFIENIIKNHSKISVYLYSVGWIIYFWMLTSLFIVVATKLLSPETIEQYKDSIIKISESLQNIHLATIAIMLTIALIINNKK